MADLLIEYAKVLADRKYSPTDWVRARSVAKKYEQRSMGGLV